MISKALSGSKMGWTEGAGAGEVREVRHSVSSQLEGLVSGPHTGYPEVGSGKQALP